MYSILMIEVESMEEKDIVLELESMGFIIFSKYAVAKIEKGEDFLSTHYWKPEDVAKEVNSGGILGVCVGGPGTYIIKVREGMPCDELRDNTKLKRRLSIKVSDEHVYLEDLYSLACWMDTYAQYDEERSIKIDNGYYTILMAGNIPNTGLRGDNQIIYMYFIRDADFKETQYQGVPDFIEAGKRVILPPLHNTK